MIYSILDIQKYNENGLIADCSSIEDIQDNLKILNPIVFKHIIPIDIDDKSIFSLNLNGTINFFDIKKDYSINIFKNNSLINIFSIYETLDKSIFHNNKLLFPIINSITIHKGYNQSSLLKCVNNYNIINVLDGETTIYIFNPKHINDIIGKNNHIKKWGHKKYLKKGDNIIIPVNRYYFIETKEYVLLYHTDINTYFTFIPNILKGVYLSFSLKGGDEDEPGGENTFNLTESIS